MPIKLIDKTNIKEYEGFELTENKSVRMGNHLSISAFARASHRLRSMVLVSGDVYCCHGRLKMRIAIDQGEESTQKWLQYCLNGELRIRYSTKRKKFVMEVFNRDLLIAADKLGS